MAQPPEDPSGHRSRPEDGGNDPRDDGIYRAILAILVASVIVGAVLTLTGEATFGSRALANAGLGMAVVAGAAYGFFRLLGRRAAQRRKGGENGGKED